MDEALRKSDLPLDLAAHPFRPVPLVNVGLLLRDAARQFGPDLPSRMVSEADDVELAMIGKVALGASTPREALSRLIAALPFYCSHEQIAMQRGPQGTVVREFFAHRFDQETLHLLLQYAATMVDRLCAMAVAEQPRFVSIEMPPHPEYGVRHIPSTLAEQINKSRSRGLTVLVEDRVLDSRFSKKTRDRVKGRRLPQDEPLRGDGTLSSSVRSVLLLMLAYDQAPSFRRIVFSAGVSERTFQRQLETEGTSYSKLLAEFRQNETLRRLNEKDGTIASIASELGYADQAGLTRAFRRWTGQAPSRFRLGQ